MNKILLIISFFLLINISSGNCQWIIQNSGTTSPLTDIKFLDENTGWCCGNGVILKTTNGGLNWVTQTLPLYLYYYKIVPINYNVVYCVGNHRTIIKTTDGGNNWTVLRTSPEYSGYEAAFFLNEQTGWIAGVFLNVYRTTNGCLTFDSTYIFWGYYTDIYFKDSLNGLLCADGGGMFRTSNSGINWEQINLVTYGIMASIRRLNVIGDKVWVVDDVHRVFHSTDFGLSWEKIDSIASDNINYCSFFSSENTGWAGGMYGVLFKTTDGGYNWSNQNLSSIAYQYGIYFINDYTGWTCGGGGRIMHTTSGGTTAIAGNSETVPCRYMLEQNYPNPFNPSTKINFAILKTALVTLKVYDMLGREVAMLVNEFKQAGYYSLDFNASNLSSGIYFYKLQANDFTDIKKMVLVK
jgi:photosystem II stability/assembly factor-like uncharacterized protein